MFRPVFSITPTILTNVEQMGWIIGFLQAVRPPSRYSRSLLTAVEAEVIHASTAIVGNSLTQEQVTQVLRSEHGQALRRDVQEVKNYTRQRWLDSAAVKARRGWVKAMAEQETE